jgi:DUF4097 and DUF4098 domain-containing protein YvlB
MKKISTAAALIAALVVSAYAQRKDFRFTAAPGSAVTVVNQRGNVTIKAAPGRQVVITAAVPNQQIEVDAGQKGNRIEVRTHTLQRTDGRVDYEISVPVDVSVRIDSGNGDVRVENVRGSVEVSNDAGNVEVRGSGTSVQVQTVNANINVHDTRQARVQLGTTGGNITMVNVSGPGVTAKSTTGNISYTGDFNGGGSYSFINHSGEIGITLPASASVDLTARSVKGSVENDFPFQKKEHTPFIQNDGRSLAGTAGTGASSVEVRTFSGKIRVKKQ